MSKSLNTELPMNSAQEPVGNPLSLLSPAQLAAELADADIEFPAAIIREIQRRREEMFPALIRVIEAATQQVKAGDRDVSSAPSLALSLLIEFQAETALAPLLASVSLPGEGPYDLYGDLVTEMFCQVVPSLGSNRLDEVLAKIRDPKVDEFVRSVLVTGVSLLYDAARRTREEVLEILRTLLRDSIDSADEKIAGPICWEILELNGTELLGLVREAFSANIIPDNFFGTLEEYEVRLIERPWSPRGWTVRDTAEDLEEWFDYHDEIGLADESEDDSWDEPLDPALIGPSEPSDTIRCDSPHVGRNEPCPCGSRKKFKKCCGRAGTLPELEI
jgi:hypothetical protein